MARKEGYKASKITRSFLRKRLPSGRARKIQVKKSQEPVCVKWLVTIGGVPVNKFFNTKMGAQAYKKELEKLRDSKCKNCGKKRSKRQPKSRKIKDRTTKRGFKP